VDFVDSVTVAKPHGKKIKSTYFGWCRRLAKNQMIFTKANEKHELWLETQNS
jgi:hypothetical protein